MSDTPRTPPPADDGFEEIPPPAKRPVARAVARPVARPPEPDSTDEDDYGDRPRRRKPARRKHWVERYVVNVRGAIAFAVLVAFLAVARIIGAATQAEPQPPAGAATVVPGDGPTAADLGPPPATPPRPAGWQDYADHLGAFVARVPDGATATAAPVKESFGSKAKPRGVRWEAGRLTYYVVAADSWPPGGRPPSSDWEADAWAGGLLNQIGFYADWVSQFSRSGRTRPVWVGGRRGAAVGYATHDEEQVLHLRAVNADGVGYFLAVAGPKGLADTATEAATFFDGFRPTPGAAPPPGATALPAADPPRGRKRP